MTLRRYGQAGKRPGKYGKNMIDAAFWKNKKVFVTGHTGFKGSWLLVMLDALGAKTAGYALQPPTFPSLYELINGDKLCKSVIADIRDYRRLKKEISDFSPEIVIHMAAQPLVIEGYKNPLETFEINALGTANVLEAVRYQKSVKAVINITTDKVYENINTTRGYKEDDRLGGYDPYSASKACSEIVTNCFRSSFFNKDSLSLHGCGVATMRAGNVIGGGDFARDRLIPDIVRALKSNEKLTIRNGDAIRPWQHVLEPLSCYIALAEKIIKNGGEFCTSFNIGPEKENCIRVLDVLEMFLDKCGAKLEYEAIPSGYHETNTLILDNTKAKKMLGYSPVYNIEKTLEKTAEWTKEYLRGGNMRTVTLKQAEEYLKKVTD
jgi:CDP-glucose 4,6-dehydratase